MRIAIVGAGIAGLSTAYFLRGRVDRLDIFEASDQIGGLARSFAWHGFDCDIAPHRLFTSNSSLRDELCMLVPMHSVKRRSKILLRDKWIRDPVSGMQLLRKFFPQESFRIVWSYLNRESLPDESFESLVLSRYGKTLHELFFAPYSEKLFGIRADEISPVWGHNKLRMGRLGDFLSHRSKLYFRSFLYPNEGGYGTIIKGLSREVQSRISLRSAVTAIRQTEKEGRPEYNLCVEDQDGASEAAYDVVVNTCPAPAFMKMLGEQVTLGYRQAMITYLLLNRTQMSPNHWIYFADRDRMLNRVAEFKHFALDSAKYDKTVVCCETTDRTEYSVTKVIDELRRAQLIEKKDVLDSMEIHLPNAYPVYDLTYEVSTARMKAVLDGHPGLFAVGRQATFAHRDVDEIYSDAKVVAAEVLRYATQLAGQ